MSSLLSAIDEYRNQELTELGLGQVCDDVSALSRAMNAAEAEVLRRVAHLSETAPFHPDGLPWPAWLAATAGMSYQPAKERVEAAAALREMPETSRAFADGEVSYQKVRELTAAHVSDPEMFSENESSLVEAARNLDPSALRRAVTYWGQSDQEMSIDEDARRYRTRRLDLSTTRDGMVVLNGCLDPVGGEYVISAIRSVTDTRFNGTDDDRTPTQRRADALVSVCRAHPARLTGPRWVVNVPTSPSPSIWPLWRGGPVREPSAAVSFLMPGSSRLRLPAASHVTPRSAGSSPAEPPNL